MHHCAPESVNLKKQDFIVLVYANVVENLNFSVKTKVKCVNLDIFICVVYAMNSPGKNY